jgi:heme exporter protein C
MNENVLAPSALPAGRTGSWLHKYANPGRFLRLAQPCLPWLAGFSLILTVTGIVWGYYFAPADWEQGDAARIMYVHVPAAWVAMAGYASLAVASFFSIIWRHPLADLAAEEIGPVGAGFTFVCLVSGALWGKPMWGAYWVWDARLTSVLVLFFLYLGHIALIRAFDNPQHGHRAAAILALVGAVNLPIIVFSVQWWNTLHQGNTISISGGSKIYITMLYPLLIASVGFYLTFITLVVARMSAAIMERKTRNLLLAAADRT